MPALKIAITIQESTLLCLDRLVKEKRYPNRSLIIQEALEEKIERIERNRLKQECEKLNPDEEKFFAEEGFSFEVGQWPEY